MPDHYDRLITKHRDRAAIGLSNWLLRHVASPWVAPTLERIIETGKAELDRQRKQRETN